MTTRKSKGLATKAADSKRVFGHELKVGDVLTDLWHSPRKRDCILSLGPYGAAGSLKKGARMATFAVASAMAIEDNTLYSVLRQPS